MVYRYFALLEFLDAEDEDIMDLLPSPACIRQLKKLHAELKDIESVSKALQAEDVNLLDVRVWFDELIAAHPALSPTSVRSRANIVHCPDFESGCVRVLKESGVRPTAAETRALRPFIRPVQATEVEGEAVSTEYFVQRIEKRRRIEARETRYSLISSIPATSNKVERYFSVARTTLGQERNGMQPITLEMILFLRENARFWDVSVVDQLV
ncbi:hypothetical protein PC120_g15652 [Phytophthora cactorum]|nr:hypothetical protein PC120_g15652 [Phytophthora cactorum]